MNISSSKNRFQIVYPCLALVLFSIVGCEQETPEDMYISQRTFEEQVGTRFTLPKSYIFTAPFVENIELNFPASAEAIWGAVGRDDNGNIYLGASSHAGENETAFLAQYKPSSNSLVQQSDTVTELKRLGLHRPGMGQNKLHSKFYQADDGYLYFASFDEQGESSDVNPTWGGHLWRKRPEDTSWEHILAADEALIAINLYRNYVYALGYWGHVLYQFNIYTEQVERIVVGSVTGHISRNFLVDPKGHAYVPYVTIDTDDIPTAVLNEYDVNLNLVGAYPMPSYRAMSMDSHHGIIGYTSMKNGDLIFTTSDGGLYYLDVFANTKDKLTYRGRIHTKGGAYIPSLFPLDGSNYVAIIGRAPRSQNYDLIIFEMATDLNKKIELGLSDAKGTLLYGTSTKDDFGNMYLVGRGHDEKTGNMVPILLSISLTD
ncbi:hypothetical protein EYC98_10655 [Halieaceae bacterium IMCC14734]|uniref:Uncharacterized protein n=1 Tax=Candidatus Litorirhabdus singularis TaxID=2518993 RepID=A0ABT3TGC1_9GAMM|nr:hypothetical protein [Candidatus Litorirhabdus singularis]MCX2981324.1 hypothetical protein [Candidatus Litorirhabdus singularis]